MVRYEIRNVQSRANMQADNIGHHGSDKDSMETPSLRISTEGNGQFTYIVKSHDRSRYNVIMLQMIWWRMARLFLIPLLQLRY